MFNTPSKFKATISQRIMLSFILLLLISFSITVFDVIGLKNFHNHFTQFNHASEDSNALQKMDQDISALERAVLVFSHAEKLSSTSQLYDLHTVLKSDLDRLIENNSFNNEAHKALLKQIHTGIEGFLEKIESLEKQKIERDTLIGDTLIKNFSSINDTMINLFSGASKDSNVVMSSPLLEIQLSISKAEILGSQYFDQHEVQLRKRVENHIENASNGLKKLQVLKKNASAAQINQAIQQLAQIKSTFNQAIRSDRNYLFLVNVVLAGELVELKNVAQQLKNESLLQQDQLFALTEKHVKFSQIYAIYIAVIGTVLAISIAWLTGRRISKPLQEITHTFSQLAQGESLKEIPGSARSDEIGLLAKAANVFRENNERTRTLLSHTEQLAKDLLLREHQLEQAVSKAKEASVIKSQFLANISHELRTPMNAILGMLALLRKTELNNRQADYAVKSEGAARSLLSLLNDILDISKAEAGKMELDPVPFSLDILKRDVGVILATNLIDKPIELVFNIAPDVPRYFRGDAMRLQQILINLGGNAIKFTERGFVTITITLQSNDACLDTETRCLQISVQDSGIGIAPENQAKIFSGFTQAEASTTRRFGGTGLGLAISQHLVELMGGKLQLESSVGYGSHFFFTIELPVLDDEAVASLNASFENSSHQHGQNRLQKMHVLLVEDNLNNQQIAMELLEAEGAIITIANHGQEALDILSANLDKTQQAGFDVVLMDLQMPVMDGMNATLAIRNKLKLSDLPIVAMTANAMASDRENCLAIGMNDHVGKPFDLQYLVAVLCKQTGRENCINNQMDDYAAPLNSSAASAISSMQGNSEFDVKAAIARMSGNQNLYLKMLPKFVVTLSNLPDQLQSYLLQGKFLEASSALHSLKGLAATMGATHLAEEASRGEKILASSPDVNSATLVVEQLCKTILQCIPSANALISNLQSTSQPITSGVAGQFVRQPSNG